MLKNNIGILLLAMTMFMFTSCEDEIVKPFEEASLDAAFLELGTPAPGFFDKGDYDNASVSFDVNAVGENGVSVSAVDVLMYYTSGPGQAAQGPFNVGSVSSVPGTYSPNLKDLVEGTLGLTAADIAVGATFDFFFEMQTSAGTIVQGGPAGARSIKLPVSCVSDIAGMYEVTTTYGAHDFLAAYPSNTTTMEIVEVNDGVYSVADFSGGLYASDGPYGDAYGTTGLAVEFLDICNTITWSGQSDPWGACIPLVGGTNSVDPATGVITISWFCEGYGENGVSVYTPQ